MRCTTTWISKCRSYNNARGKGAAADTDCSFCDDVERIWDKNYMPTDQDLLRSRLRTTGITETVFDLGQLTYRMFDVGNVNCLLFLVAISGYDQCLVEDKDGVSAFWFFFWRNEGKLTNGCRTK